MRASSLHFAFAFSLAVTVPSFMACGGEDGAAGPPGPAGQNVQTGDAGEAPIAASGAKPVHPVAGVAFTDTQPACSRLSGKVTIAKATDESDVSSYALYFGSSATTKLYLTPLATLPANGKDQVFQLFDEGFPDAATHLLAYSVNAAGESASAAAVPITELVSPVSTDISTGVNGGGLSAAIVDAKLGRLYVAATGAQQKAELYICGLDGSSCIRRDISAVQGMDSGYTPSIVQDPKDGSIVVVARNQANGNRASLFRCTSGGVSCTHADISAGSGSGSGDAPVALIDEVNDKLVVATHDQSNAGKLALFRCSRTGLGCTYADISVGQGSESGRSPSAVIDRTNSKLLVVTSNATTGGGVSLFRCNLDGTSCTHSDLSGGRLLQANPRVVIDPISNKLVVVATEGSNQGELAMYRCNLDGTACSYVDLSPGEVVKDTIYPRPILDIARQKLVVGGRLASGSPVLFHCALDGTACRRTDLSELFFSINYGDLALDPTTGTALYVGNAFNPTGAALRLWSVCGR